MAATKEAVTIKVPRVLTSSGRRRRRWDDDDDADDDDSLTSSGSSFTKNLLFLKVKTHIEEAKRLLSTNFRKPRGEHLVRYLGASYDDFRKEIWVVSALFVILLFWEEQCWKFHIHIHSDLQCWK